MANRVNGVVKWFKDDKGFGFIEHEGQDYFVHFRNIKCNGFKSLPKGGAVSFIITKGKKGMQADEVELI